MDDDISPFIGQKRADILRGVKEFMDRGKQEGARGMICVMIAFGDATESHLSFRSASGALACPRWRSSARWPWARSWRISKKPLSPTISFPGSRRSICLPC